jgi:uncharacterized membrane protein
MERQYPHHFAALRGRALTDPARQRLLFRLIVLAESAVVIALTLASLAMVGALAGVMAPDSAKALALLAVAGFSAIWIAFLTGGNHYVYWLCHGNAQRTHFDLLLWGLGTQVFLALAGVALVALAAAALLPRIGEAPATAAATAPRWASSAGPGSMMATVPWPTM